MTIRDSGADGLESKPINEGIGLTNTRARLQQLYGAENSSFEWHSEPRGGFRAELAFPFRLHNRSNDEG